jgi:hypothetical protein
LKTALASFEAEIHEDCRGEGKTGGPKRGAPGGGAEHNCERGHQRGEDDEK